MFEIGRDGESTALDKATRCKRIATANHRLCGLVSRCQRIVENYRTAHEIAVRNERGQASTEDLRKAMIHYRALFEDLLEIQQDEQAATLGFVYEVEHTHPHLLGRGAF